MGLKVAILTQKLELALTPPDERRRDTPVRRADAGRRTAAVKVAAPSLPAYISAAVADSARPAEDRQRDAARKPAETLDNVTVSLQRILRNSADKHTAKIFDPEIRGHTHQFLLKFKKP